MTDNMLGRDWKSLRCRWCCNNGRISAAMALFTSSLSTPRIFTGEFAIAYPHALSRLGEYNVEATTEKAWVPTTEKVQLGEMKRSRDQLD
ncbi:hypothetical protein SESBI_37739 [Sesbania bispinosa]|nr:hypothetical protein SESBI_37739 [Sesbania bispinosa]